MLVEHVQHQKITRDPIKNKTAIKIQLKIDLDQRTKLNLLLQRKILEKLHQLKELVHLKIKVKNQFKNNIDKNKHQKKKILKLKINQRNTEVEVEVEKLKFNQKVKLKRKLLKLTHQCQSLYI